jgi:hypothetical protein
MPASKNPNKTRQAISPSTFLTRPMPTVDIPQRTVIEASHRDGDIFLMIMLDGTSKIMYCIEKIVSQAYIVKTHVCFRVLDILE